MAISEIGMYVRGEFRRYRQDVPTPKKDSEPVPQDRIILESLSPEHSDYPIEIKVARDDKLAVRKLFESIERGSIVLISVGMAYGNLYFNELVDVLDADAA